MIKKFRLASNPYTTRGRHDKRMSFGNFVCTGLIPTQVAIERIQQAEAQELTRKDEDL